MFSYNPFQMIYAIIFISLLLGAYIFDLEYYTTVLNGAAMRFALYEQIGMNR